jgi:hypothetical protein
MGEGVTPFAQRHKLEAGRQIKPVRTISGTEDFRRGAAVACISDGGLAVHVIPASLVSLTDAPL